MSSRDGTIIGYLLVLAAGVTLQIAAIRRPDHFPSLGRVFTHVMNSRAGRVAVFFAWAWIACTSSRSEPAPGLTCAPTLSTPRNPSPCHPRG